MLYAKKSLGIYVLCRLVDVRCASFLFPSYLQDYSRLRLAEDKQVHPGISIVFKQQPSKHTFLNFFIVGERFYNSLIINKKFSIVNVRDVKLLRIKIVISIFKNVQHVDIFGRLYKPHTMIKLKTRNPSNFLKLQPMFRTNKQHLRSLYLF